MSTPNRFISMAAMFGAAFTTAAAGEESPALQRIAVEHYADKYRLSPEDAEVRIALQDQAAGLDDRLAALLGEQWAEMWYDAADRGRLKIGMTRAASARRNEVAALLRDQGIQEQADLVSVTYTLAELVSKQDTLRSTLMDMIMSGHAQTSRDPESNRVVVTALTILPAGEEKRIQQAASIPGVTVRRVNAPDLFGQFQSCPSTTQCEPPLRGGIRLFPPQNLMYTEFCTLGFMARHRVNTSHMLAMTAGHCVFENQHESGSWGAPFDLSDNNDSFDFKAIGPSYGFVLGGPPGVDAGVVFVDPTGFWGTPVPPAPKVLMMGSANTPFDPDYYITGTSESTVGQLLCMTGTATNTTCAFVGAVSFDQVFQFAGVNVLLKNLVATGTCVNKARDSGGPVYKNHRAFGIHVGKKYVGQCAGLYQKIRIAQNELNVDILTQ